jgi:hypothetical protein
LTDIARALVLAAMLLSGSLVIRGTFGTDRYDLVPAGGGAVYRLDRLTGGVSICNPALCRPLPTLTPVAPGQAPQPSSPAPAELKSPPEAPTAAT